MTVIFHPAFPKDVQRFEGEYAQISEGLATRFRQEVDSALDLIKTAPTRAGHFLNLGSTIVPEFRRRNLKAFPFFVLYGVAGNRVVIGSLIPSRSDPLTWLTRFAPSAS